MTDGKGVKFDLFQGPDIENALEDAYQVSFLMR